MSERRKSFRPVKRPGAATRKAKREGLSLSAWERKHYNDPGRTGRQARFAEIQKGWRKTGPRKHKRSSTRTTERRTRRG